MINDDHTNVDATRILQASLAAHEPEDPDGIVPVSRARLVKVPPGSAGGIPDEGNQAAAS
jgi:hypothetical protein